jgi:effector-binding domain-containing protein
MEIDFRLPFSAVAVSLDEVPMGANSKGIKAFMYKIQVRWKDIVAIEAFHRVWMFPEDNSDKCVLVTDKRVYIIRENFDEVSKVWENYVLWAEQKSMFRFN